MRFCLFRCVGGRGGGGGGLGGVDEEDMRPIVTFYDV